MSALFVGTTKEHFVMPADVSRSGPANRRLRKQLLDGFKYLRAGERQVARTTFSQVIETNPEIAAGALGLGGGYFQEQKLQAALEGFSEAGEGGRTPWN